MNAHNIHMVPVITYDGGVKWVREDKGLGVVPVLIAAAPAIMAVGKQIVNLLKKTGKSGREAFFEARDNVTKQIAQAYQKDLGYSYDGMMNYWFLDNSLKVKPAPPGANGMNEKTVIDRWWSELNKLNIGNDGSGDILKVQSISLKSFDPAFDRLEEALANYATKYMSGDPAAALPTKAQAEAMQTAQASIPGGSLVDRYKALPSDMKNIVLVTGALGILVLVTAGLKAAKVI